MRHATWLGVILGGCLLALNVSAATSSTPLESSEVPRAMIEKLGRGLGNAVSGWLELPLTMKNTYKRKDPATSLCTGTLIGAFKAIGRTAVGVFEAVTFLFPIPENYAPILPPLEYAILD